MKKFILPILLMALSAHLNGQIHPNSSAGKIHIIGDIYGDKSSYTNVDPMAPSNQRTTSLCPCTLEDVCNSGDSTGHHITARQFIADNGLGIIGDFKYNELYLGNPYNYFTFNLSCQLLTANHVVHPPDWDGTMSTVVSPVTTYVGDSSNQHSYASNAGVGVKSGGVTAIGLSRVGATGLLLSNNSATNYGNIVISECTDSSKLNYWPNEPGRILVNNGDTISTILTSATSWVIPHALGYSNYRVFIEWETPPPAIARYSIISKTSSSFTIAFTAPVTGVYKIAWQSFKGH